MNQTLTYAEAAKRSKRLASALQAIGVSGAVITLLTRDEHANRLLRRTVCRGILRADKRFYRGTDSFYDQTRRQRRLLHRKSIGVNSDA